MIRGVVLFIPRVALTVACAVIVVAAAVPLFWLRDRFDPRSTPVDGGDR